MTPAHAQSAHLLSTQTSPDFQFAEMLGQYRYNEEKPTGRTRSSCILFIATLATIAMAFLAGLTLSSIASRFTVPESVFTYQAETPKGLNSQSSPSMYNKTTRTCGNTPQEARSLDCAFDLVSFSWLPRQCHDATLTAEFLQHADWSWYTGNSSSEGAAEQLALPETEVARGDSGDLYVTGSYHVVHCMYMWRKLHRGLEIEASGSGPTESGAWIDSYTRSLSHTHHCSRYILDLERTLNWSWTERDNRTIAETGLQFDELQQRLKEAFQAVKVKIRTKYPSCPTSVV